MKNKPKTGHEIMFGNGPFVKEKFDGRFLPKRCYEIWELAARANLTQPLGRALYAINRLQNGWQWNPQTGFRDPLDLMTKCRESTARRWRAHWKRGGSIKKLGK